MVMLPQFRRIHPSDKPPIEQTARQANIRRYSIASYYPGTATESPLKLLPHLLRSLHCQIPQALSRGKRAIPVIYQIRKKPKRDSGQPANLRNFAFQFRKLMRSGRLDQNNFRFRITIFIHSHYFPKYSLILLMRSICITLNGHCLLQWPQGMQSDAVSFIVR